MGNPHNHPSRCCCVWAREADSYEPVRYCPACPEHGELTQLGEQPGPGAISDTLIAADMQRTEYPCCHQLAGRPHTDYCRQEATAGNPAGWRAAEDPAR